MRAIVQSAYGAGGVYRLAEIEEPVPKDDEVLIRVKASSVHADVWHVMTGLPYVLRLMGSGLKKPLQAVPGTDLAGTVVSVGKAVTRFKAGDEVFGETLRGMQWCNGGAWAELATAPESGLALKPARASFEEAAAVPTAGLIALMNLRAQGQLKAGQEVLIHGAGGGVGTLALQLAKGMGAQVTAVDRAEKLEMLKGLGADHVIDYEKEDFTRAGKLYDLIFDLPGDHGFSGCRRALKPTGIWVLIGHANYGKGVGLWDRWTGEIPGMLLQMLWANFERQLPRPSFKLPEKSGEMEFLRRFLEEGKLTPFIDRSFPLEQAEEAMLYLQSGRAKGKVMLKL